MVIDSGRSNSWVASCCVSQKFRAQGLYVASPAHHCQEVYISSLHKIPPPPRPASNTRLRLNIRVMSWVKCTLLVGVRRGVVLGVCAALTPGSLLSHKGVLQNTHKGSCRGTYEKYRDVLGMGDM